MKIIIGCLVAGALALFGAPTAAADPSGDQGQPNATEEKVQGAPTAANGLTSVFSQTLKDSGSSLGEHSGGFAPGQDEDKDGAATGRVGVGNLGRTDGLPGDDANSHFTGQLVINMGEDAACLPPGNNENPDRGNPNGC